MNSPSLKQKRHPSFTGSVLSSIHRPLHPYAPSRTPNFKSVDTVLHDHIAKGPSKVHFVVKFPVVVVSKACLKLVARTPLVCHLSRSPSIPWVTKNKSTPTNTWAVKSRNRTSSKPKLPEKSRPVHTSNQSPKVPSTTVPP